MRGTQSYQVIYHLQQQRLVDGTVEDVTNFTTPFSWHGGQHQCGHGCLRRHTTTTTAISPTTDTVASNIAAAGGTTAVPPTTDTTDIDVTKQ